MNLAAKVFAGQPVGKFVQGDDEKDDCHEERDRRDTVELGEVLNEFARVRYDGCGPQQNERGREHQEVRREKEAQSGNQTVEEPRRVENFEPQVQHAAANSFLPAPFSRRSFFRFEEVGLGQILDEGPQSFRGKSCPELFFCFLPNDIERRLPVELLRDEMLGFPKAKEITGDRVFDDEDCPACRLLTADDQIAPEFWRRRNHDL